IKVFKFLELDEEKHKHKFKYFDPTISIKNIGQWKKILSKRQSDEIRNSLSDFLDYYNYER
ncbi:hypothetical protein AB4450_18770, partial [Vibrio breoganii]